MSNKRYFSERLIIRAAENMKRQSSIGEQSVVASRALKNWTAKTNSEIRAAFKVAMSQSA